MKKEVKIDLKNHLDKSLLELEKVIVMYGFSYHACKIHNVNRVGTLTGYQIILFGDLDKKIKDNLGHYHALYMSSITKKCVDDLYHLLEALIINSWKEVRQIPFKVKDSNRIKYGEFLNGEYDDSIWKVLRFVKKLNFKFPSEITALLGNLKELRKSLHDGNILKEDVNLAYKGFDVKCFATIEGGVVEINLDEALDVRKYDEESVRLEFPKPLSLVDKEKYFKKGYIPEFNPNEFQNLCLTLKDYILPTINSTFTHFLESDLGVRFAP